MTGLSELRDNISSALQKAGVSDKEVAGINKAIDDGTLTDDQIKTISSNIFVNSKNNKIVFLPIKEKTVTVQTKEQQPAKVQDVFTQARSQIIANRTPSTTKSAEQLTKIIDSLASSQLPGIKLVGIEDATKVKLRAVTTPESSGVAGIATRVFDKKPVTDSTKTLPAIKKGPPPPPPLTKSSSSKDEKVIQTDTPSPTAVLKPEEKDIKTDTPSPTALAKPEAPPSPRITLQKDIEILKSDVEKLTTPPFGAFFSTIPVAKILIEAVEDLKVPKTGEQILEKQKLVNDYKQAVIALQNFKQSIPENFVDFLSGIPEQGFKNAMINAPHGVFQRTLVSQYATEKFDEGRGALEKQFNDLWKDIRTSVLHKQDGSKTESTFNQSAETVRSFLDSTGLEEHWKKLFTVQNNFDNNKDQIQASLLPKLINIFADEFKKCMALDKTISEFIEKSISEAREAIQKDPSQKDKIRGELREKLKMFTDSLPKQSKDLANTFLERLAHVENF